MAKKKEIKTSKSDFKRELYLACYYFEAPKNLSSNLRP